MSNFYSEQKNGQDARDGLMRGAKKVYDPVSATQGPKGRNIAINNGFDFEFQRDGLKVSRTINPKDKTEWTGAMTLREAAEKQVRSVGDGTTLVISLGYNIANEAMTLINSGVEPMGLLEGLERGRNVLVDAVEKLSKPIKTEEEKIQIATTSSQDANLGKMIGSTWHKIGPDGIFVADESQSSETELEHQEGISFDRGFLSYAFVTDPRTLTATVRNAHILLIDREFDDIYEFLPFAEKEIKNNNVKNLVIIAREVTGSALASMVETKKKGMMNIICIKAPAFGKYQSEMLEDIAIMTGGTVLDEASGKLIKDLTFADLGFAEAVKSSIDSTTILGNKGTVKAIEDRKASIKMLMKEADKDVDREKLKERLARMTGGVWVIKAGGATEIEMKKRQEQIDDAIKATRAAIIGGILPGGEVALLKAREELKPTNENEDYAFRILRKAVEKPFEKLLTNAGLNPGYYLAKLEEKPFGYGVNVMTLKVEDMIESGIVDPTRVVTHALPAAVSVAILLMTSNGTSDLYEKLQNEQ